MEDDKLLARVHSRPVLARGYCDRSQPRLLHVNRTHHIWPATQTSLNFSILRPHVYLILYQLSYTIHFAYMPRKKQYVCTALLVEFGNPMALPRAVFVAQR
jgi:hypothetical protein